MSKPHIRPKSSQLIGLGIHPRQADPGIVNVAYSKDSYANASASLGMDQNNLLAGGTYTLNPITRNRTLLEYAYRGSWVCRAVCDCVADDMTREGVDIASQMKPDQIEELADEMQQLEIMTALNEGVRWGRLFGGAIGVMQIEGQDWTTPLRMDSIAKQQFKGLMILDRWTLNPDWTNPIARFGPMIGKPEFYEVAAGIAGVPVGKIHSSRCIRFEGAPLPYYQRLAENGWGMSVLESMWDRLMAFDSATTGAAQLAFKAHIRTLKIKGLRAGLGGSPAANKSLTSAVEFVRKYQMQEGLTVIDIEDEFQTDTYTFSGVAELLDRLAGQVSGATGIPLVRLLGEQPGGLNADSSGVIRVYFDTTKAAQESKLRPGMSKVLELCHRSRFGVPPEPGFSFKFRPLWQLEEKEKAEISGSVVNAVNMAFAGGIIDRPTAMRELRESSDLTGVFTNVTDELIADADQNPPQPPGLAPDVMNAAAKEKTANDPLAAGEGGPPGAGGATRPPGKPAGPIRPLKPEEEAILAKVANDGGAPVSRETFDRLLGFTLDDWQESKHPRGQPENAGEFGPGGGGGESTRPKGHSGGIRPLTAQEHKALDKALGVPQFVEPTPEAFVAARDASKRGGFLSQSKPDDLAGQKLFLSEDGKSGVAVADGDIQNVFNNGGAPGAGRRALMAAIDAGGRTLDCYDGHLPDMYRQFGFVETGRMKFNPEFAHADWNAEKYGHPDVVFMAWKGYVASEHDTFDRAKRPAHWIHNDRSGRIETDFDAAKQYSRDQAKSEGSGVDRGAGTQPGTPADTTGNQSVAGAGSGNGRSLSPDHHAALDKIIADGGASKLFTASQQGTPPTLDEIVASAGAAQYVAEVEAKIAKGRQTVNEFKQADGTYTPEREALHQKIISAILSPDKVVSALPAKGEKPTVAILGGRGGSGKSWLAKGGPVAGNKFISINPDEVQEHLPGYEGWNAALYHVEAAEISQRIEHAARSLGLNIIRDSTLRTGAVSMAQVALYKKAGYRIEGHYMFASPATATARGLKRFQKPGGRYVPPSYIMGSTTNEYTFDLMRPDFDKWSVWNNDADKGEPKLVAKGGEDGSA